MCGTCGCGEGEKRIEGVHDHVHAGGAHRHDDAHAHVHAHAPSDPPPNANGHAHTHTHTHADGTTHSHPHSHTHTHADGTTHAHPHGHDGEHAHHDPAFDGARLVSVERDLLAHNDAIAEQNRRRFQATRTLTLNLVSSPGSGKTALLVETLRRIGQKYPVAVIEGDQETTADADRIRATGAPAIQINTGKGCHLDADLVRGALTRLGAPPDGVLFIENVGNLVCPAGFDLGEAQKVVIVSVTEGEDKPLKYSGMFAAAGLMVVTKTDLLPHLDFDVDRLIDNARRVHPGIAVLKVSAKTGDGMDRWLQWLDAARTLRLAAD
jgi:hydrogenase nickel incorporation protein HypB